MTIKFKYSKYVSFDTRHKIPKSETIHGKWNIYGNNIWFASDERIDVEKAIKTRKLYVNRKYSGAFLFTCSEDMNLFYAHIFTCLITTGNIFKWSNFGRVFEMASPRNLLSINLGSRFSRTGSHQASKQGSHSVSSRISVLKMKRIASDETFIGDVAFSQSL